MKNIITSIALIAGMLFFTSCNDKPDPGKDLDIKYQLTVSINTKNVVKDLKDLDNTDAFPGGTIDDGSHVRVNFFIYDADGANVYESTQIVDDFSKSVEIKNSLKPGDYTLVVAADMVENTGDKIEFACWEFKNTDDLENLRIVDLQYNGFKYKAMGVSKSTINLEKAESVKINVEPVGALITFYFSNLYVSEIAYLYYTWDKNSDYYLVNEEKSNVSNTDVENEYEIEAKYTGFYDQRYFLPVQNVTLTWATLDAKPAIIKQGSTTFNAQQAVNQIITVDVRTGNTKVETKSAISLEDIEKSRKMQGKK
ncbi:MAG: hypothetical protein LBS88_07435 [Tannerellaceae bacterium]|jgi:hypothetical protein|nr:hypothetical protein [Tannerellaceae bacterium]